MSKISIYGYKGSTDDLKRELSLGMTVKDVRVIASGKGGMSVVYEEKPTGGRPTKYDKGQIKALRTAGKSYGEIAKEVGCSKTYVISVCKEQ